MAQIRRSQGFTTPFIKRKAATQHSQTHYTFNPTFAYSLTKKYTVEKRAHKYKFTLEHLATSKGESSTHQPLQLEFDNHDDIFSIIERIQAKNLFNNDKNQAAEFAIGLKMFSEVMLKNRKHPLFEELAPAFSEFMKKLKSM
jgi:hypothetical protein